MSQVSIVIPCYNDAPEHLEACVESAKGQTYADLEVIVVDDGSTRPDTLAALTRLQDVRLVRRANGGTGAALNSGIREATGELIIPVGADDVLETDFVAALCDRLERESPNVVGVYPSVHFIGERSGEAGSPDSVVLADIAVRNKVVAATLYRRVDWERVGGYGEFNDCSEDWYFWAVLLGRTQGRMVKESQARYYYRIRTGSRNTLNRTFERKENARAHIAAALPDKLPELFAAAAQQADIAIADSERYGAVVLEWRQRLRLLRPAYKYFNRLLRPVRSENNR